MSAIQSKPLESQPRIASEIDLPPFAMGDNLTREEFLRIWDGHPAIKKAELLGGIVYMASPVSRDHGVMEGYAGAWLVSYHAATPGTEVGHKTTLLLLNDIPQPDIYLRSLPEYGGASWIEGKYLAGSPELLVEVCRSSAAYDLHQKFDLYQAAGVREYLAILLHEKEIRWHSLDNGAYQRLVPGSDGLWRSRVFPGLWLDGTALFLGDMGRVLARLQEGIDSAELKAFVDGLVPRERRSN